MNARVTAHIIALALLCLLPSTVLRAADPTSISLQNEFLRAVVNTGAEETGRFSVRTTGGDPTRPSSQNKHLVFGGGAPWTSYTSLRVDDDTFVFGGPTRRRAGLHATYGKLLTTPATLDDAIVCTEQCGDVEVTQALTFMRGTSTRMLDTLGIAYRITNRGTTPHQVGLRVLLDTMCGSNDGAPIRAGSQAITTATTLTGADIPDYWQAFDDLANPSVISQGTLRGAGLTAPDKVLFADWGTLADDPWEPKLTAGQTFIRKGETDPDTATALLWNPIRLEPGESKTVTTAYGIGYINVTPGQLTLGLTAPAETVFAHERTQTFTVTGYLQNSGSFDGRDVHLTLTLPEGLSLVGGSELKQRYPQLAAGETVQASWVLKPNGKAGGKLNLTLAASSANIEPNKNVCPIQVIVPKPKIQCTPAAQRVPLTTNGDPTIIPIEINLSPAEAFHGVRFTLKYDASTIRPFDVTRGRAFVEDGRLLSGWKVDKSALEDGILVITARRTAASSLTQAEVNLATVKFRAVTVGKSTLSLGGAALITETGPEQPVDVSIGSIEVVGDAN